MLPKSPKKQKNNWCRPTIGIGTKKSSSSSSKGKHSHVNALLKQQRLRTRTVASSSVSMVATLPSQPTTRTLASPYLPAQTTPSNRTPLTTVLVSSRSAPRRRPSAPLNQKLPTTVSASVSSGTSTPILRIVHCIIPHQVCLNCCCF